MRAPEYQAERGRRQEARILASLTESPKTSSALAEALHLSRCNVELYVKRIRKDGRVHCASHEKRPGRPAPVWAAGSGKDAEYVPMKRPSSIKSFDDRVAEVRSLLFKSHTAADVAAALHVTQGRANVYIRELRKPDEYGKRAVRIVGWKHPGSRGDLAPIYRLGNGQDVQKRGETRAERYRKEKADPDKHERNLRARRARYHLKKARSAPVSWFAALPGAQSVAVTKEAA